MKLKKVYFIFFEEWGEWDAFFEASGKLITYWHGNDGSWRDEYFSELIAYMGYETAQPTAKQYEKMKKVFAKELQSIGCGPEEDDIEA